MVSKTTILQTLNSILHAERPRLILWAPVLLMLGIGAYFALPQEPPPLSGAYAATGLGAVLLLRRRWLWYILPFLLISCGFAAAQLRTQMMATPLLTEEVRFASVEGVIEEIITTEKGAKLVLGALAIDAERQGAARARIAVRDYDPAWQVGDAVRVKATLMPLPSPVMPGAYDFARYFYFQGIGAVGYAVGKVEVTGAAERGDTADWLANLRHRIGDSMRERIGGGEGAVAAALSVGEMGAIPEAVNEAMRDSGLAHVLSISGLHLALASGIVFFAVRLLLSLYPPLALRINAKKAAAAFALVSSFIYLLLAGAPVPAQRSFIMVAFVLAAVLIDRKGISVYSLAWAAMAILLLFPESMLGASFQMSFAATLAIVALYERFGGALYRAGAPWWSKPLYGVLAIAATSVVATLSTAPFVIYHFNRFATYGLLANVLVMPLASFIIMPGVVIAFLLMPFGLEGAGYWILGFGVKWMNTVAAWIAALPHATVSLPAPTDAGLVAAAFGFLLLTLFISRLRLWGLLFIAAGMATMALHRPADMLISGDGRQVMARLDSGEYAMLKGTGRSFVAEAWMRRMGVEEVRPSKEFCKNQLCTVERGERVLRFVQKPEALGRACAERSDALAVWWRVSAEECPGAALLIDRNALEKGGAQAVYLEPGGALVESARRQGVERPWTVEPQD